MLSIWIWHNQWLRLHSQSGSSFKSGRIWAWPGSSDGAWSNESVQVANLALADYTLVSSEKDVGLEPGRFEIFIMPPSPHDKLKHGRSGEEEECDERAVVIALLYPVPKRFLSTETSGLWVDLEKEPTRVDIDLSD